MDISQRVAYRFLNRQAYEASGDFEKVVGKFISRELGITDAPKEFFDVVRSKAEASLAEADMELDMKNKDVYPYIRRAIMEASDEMEMIK